MSQQGGRPTGPTGPIGPEDDWWGQLYDDSTDDTGPTAAPDSLDDRFASAAGTLARGPAAPGPGEPTHPTPPPSPTAPEPGRPWWSRTPPAVPGPRTGDDAPRGSAGRAGGAAAEGTGSGGRGRYGSPGSPGAGDGGPGDGGPSPAAGPSRPRAPWEPPSATSAGPRSFPAAGPEPGGTGAPGARRPTPAGAPPPGEPSGPVAPGAGSVWSGSGHSGAPSVPAGAPPAGRTGSASPPVPGAGRPPAPRRPDPRGPTTSGSGAGDLREPPEAVPPPRAVSGLPPLPPPFLPSSDAADRDYVGSGPPTYDAAPSALPPADPDGLDGLVPDTVLEGARYGTCTLRAVSVRGDSARYRGEPRRDALLVARFGAGEQALILVAMATGARATAGAHRAAAEVCRWIGRAVGRSHARLAEDLRAARRGDLKSGLHRLTDRSLGRLRAGAAEQGLAPDEYAATLRCLLLPADPGCRTRVFFGVGAGGLLRLRDGAWQDMEPDAGDVTGEPVLGFGSAPSDAPSETPEGDRLTMDLGITTPPGPYDGPPAGPPREPFRFRASVARPGDVLLMCTAGLAEPLLSEPELGELLARRWAGRPAPGPGEFLADSGVRVKGYADDRTAAAVWEA
ncbi:protein phosphatase 2C domain-containing protein [Streptomyces sp. CB09001]|uniref:protein phosphatase 2C domain-containing protein n=1 Tax=Streptomyces sp. CB09001 TaxID=2083284 RepID=UPI00196256A8|nr:protein phosphatase 2C domain-containing protein [Streptomyces sp. CB09001]